MLVIILIVALVGISHVVILYNSNIILLMIIFVVSSIFVFVGYYIRDDVSNENFKLLKVVFLGLIILMLISYGMVMFVR